MNKQRRNVLKAGSGAALMSILATAGIITPGMALADWNKAALTPRAWRYAEGAGCRCAGR